MIAPERGFEQAPTQSKLALRSFFSGAMEAIFVGSAS